jgi:hypothetical protein
VIKAQPYLEGKPKGDSSMVVKSTVRGIVLVPSIGRAARMYMSGEKSLVGQALRAESQVSRRFSGRPRETAMRRGLQG